MERLTTSAFQVMPWKNGGGTTLELFHIRDEDGDTLFRLSQATVKQDGPFSLFPGIDRTLIVLHGQGLILEMAGEMIELRPGDEPFRFSGEVPIHCDLIQDTVEDFNVMVDRSYGHAEVTVQVGPIILVAEDLLYVYRPAHKELWVLHNEHVTGDFAEDETVVIVRVSRS